MFKKRTVKLEPEGVLGRVSPGYGVHGEGEAQLCVGKGLQTAEVRWVGHSVCKVRTVAGVRGGNHYRGLDSRGLEF